MVVRIHPRELRRCGLDSISTPGNFDVAGWTQFPPRELRRCGLDSISTPGNFDVAAGLNFFTRSSKSFLPGQPPPARARVSSRVRQHEAARVPAGTYSKLLQNALNVVPRSVFANEQSLGNLSVGVPGDDQQCHARFAAGQTEPCA